MVDSIEKLRDELEMMNGFRYLENDLDTSGGCEAAVKSKNRLGKIQGMWNIVI